MNGWQQKTFISLEHQEAISHSRYELHPLESQDKPKNQEELRNEKDDR